MVDSTRVLVVGTDNVTAAEIYSRWDDAPFDVVSATYKDVIQSGYFVVIIQDEGLCPAQRQEVLTYLQEVDRRSTVKIIVSREEKLWRQATNAVVYANAKEMMQDIKSVVEKAHAKAKRAENLAQNLKTSFLVLQLVMRHPGITSSEIAQRIDRSEMAVRRFLEELQMAGRPIEYDATYKGWKIKE